MKKRYNISIEIETMEKAQKHIKNISAYIEKCLSKSNRYYELSNRKELTPQEQLELNKLYEVANYNVW